MFVERGLPKFQQASFFMYQTTIKHVEKRLPLN